MELRPLESVEAIQDWQAQARNAGLALTNLFPDDRKMSDWLRRQAAYAIDASDDCRLMVIREGDFDRLFFMAKSYDEAAQVSAAYRKESEWPCVLDVVGPQAAQEGAKAALEGCGFVSLKTLTRMQRRKVDENVESVISAAVRTANEDDALHIHLALHKFFDARAEQLPCLDEVRSLCVNGASFVAMEGNVVTSFLLGELMGKKGIVRYWFTTPEGRGKGVGGMTMRAFFDYCLAQGSTWQELWVLDDNANAIKRYEHYGFVFDRLKDTVFIKENA